MDNTCTCQNRRKVANLDLSDLDNLERLNRIQIWLVDWYHPWENREKLQNQILRIYSKVQKGHTFDLSTLKNDLLSNSKEASCQKREESYLNRF